MNASRNLNRLLAFLLFFISPLPLYGQVPEMYSKYFEHRADNRSLLEKALNRVNLSLTDAGPGFALIAGVDLYPKLRGYDSELRPAAVDVISLASYLKKYEHFDEVVVLRNEAVTYDSLTYFLEQYFPERLRGIPKARFLFAYSGHGVQTDGDLGYLLKYNAEEFSSEFGINLNVVRGLYSRILRNVHQSLVLINACHAGAFLGRSPQGRGVPQMPGHWVITAGGNANEIVWHDPKIGPGSIFFEKFFAALDGRADRAPQHGENVFGDGIVTVEELFAYLKEEIRYATNGSQNPRMGNISIHGDHGSYFLLDRQDQDYELDIVEWDSSRRSVRGMGRKDVPTIDMAAEVAPRPHVSMYHLSYDPVTQLIEMKAKGGALPVSLDLTLNHEGSGRQPAVKLKSTAGDEHDRTYSTKVGQALKRYTTLQVEVHGQSLVESSGRWVVVGSSSRWQWQWLKHPREAEFYDLREEERYNITLPLRAEEYTFNLIGTNVEYSIGLTDEKSKDPELIRRNLAGWSSHPRGVFKVPLVQPFLIGVNEVTNRQYLSWLKSTDSHKATVPEELQSYLKDDLPVELADIPVTNIRCDEARRFAQWLQGSLVDFTSGWKIRLPHEVEWEMAARGGDSRDYAFKNNIAKGLASLGVPRIRPVGSNSSDRSQTGVRDLSGNVREWTESVSNEHMLEILKVQFDLGLSGWDPANPYAIRGLFEKPPEDITKASRNMIVRGGTNGENPMFFLVSLRRQREIAHAADDLGFRLVLVPVEGQ